MDIVPEQFCNISCYTFVQIDLTFGRGGGGRVSEAVFLQFFFRVLMAWADGIGLLRVVGKYRRNNTGEAA